MHIWIHIKFHSMTGPYYDQAMTGQYYDQALSVCKPIQMTGGQFRRGVSSTDHLRQGMLYIIIETGPGMLYIFEKIFLQGVSIQ